MMMIIRCTVALDDGQSCGAACAVLDAARGILVCIKHAPRCNVCADLLYEPSTIGVHARCMPVRTAQRLRDQVRVPSS
jgi:hypothetical protein